jgi:hypothetical protein
MHVAKSISIQCLRYTHTHIISYRALSTYGMARNMFCRKKVERGKKSHFYRIFYDLHERERNEMRKIGAEMKFSCHFAPYVTQSETIFPASFHLSSLCFLVFCASDWVGYCTFNDKGK